MTVRFCSSRRNLRKVEAIVSESEPHRSDECRVTDQFIRIIEYLWKTFVVPRQTGFL